MRSPGWRRRGRVRMRAYGRQRRAELRPPTPRLSPWGVSVAERLQAWVLRDISSAALKELERIYKNSVQKLSDREFVTWPDVVPSRPVRRIEPILFDHTCFVGSSTTVCPTCARP